ncbi:MAG: phage N-6-adenine-methyltransferase [Aeromonas sp.]
MADFRGSTTELAFRDCSMTPRWLFRALDAEFNFCLDAAALPSSALCQRYLTPQDDALHQDWRDFIPAGELAPWAWLNPPYSRIKPWVEKAIAMRDLGIATVMLVPQDTTAKWYPTAQASEVRHITGGRNEHGHFVSGRVNFLDYSTGQEMKGNPKGSMLLIFRPRDRSMRITDTSKLDLMRQGGALS